MVRIPPLIVAVLQASGKNYSPSHRSCKMGTQNLTSLRSRSPKGTPPPWPAWPSLPFVSISRVQKLVDNLVLPGPCSIAACPPTDQATRKCPVPFLSERALLPPPSVCDDEMPPRVDPLDFVTPTTKSVFSCFFSATVHRQPPYSSGNACFQAPRFH